MKLSIRQSSILLLMMVPAGEIAMYLSRGLGGVIKFSIVGAIMAIGGFAIGWGKSWYEENHQ